MLSVMITNHLFRLFLLLFCYAPIGVSHSACLQGFESAYQPFHQAMAAGAVQSRVESVNLASLEKRLQSAQAGVNRWPITLDASAQPYQQDSQRRQFSGRTDTLSLSIDLVETLGRRARTDSRLEQERLELNRLQQQQRLLAQTLIILVEIASLNDLQVLLSSRKTHLEQRSEYFSIRREMGDSVSSELLDTESRLLETLNKLDAVNIRHTSESLKLVSHQSVSNGHSALPLPSVRHISTNVNLLCPPESSFSVQDRTLAVQRASHQINLFQQRQGVQVGLFSNWVHESVQQSQPQQTTTSGVRLSYNVWSGGASRAEKTALVNAHLIALDELALHHQLEADRIQNWNNSKAIFLSAMQANHIKIEALQQQVAQLSERRGLEAGLFVASSDTQLQLSLLLESDIGVRKDFIVANLGLLATYTPHP